MASYPDKLTPLQREFIEAFFGEESSFRLTGGAALAGYHLGHRMSQDVDLFGPGDADMAEALRHVERAAIAVGGRTERLRTSPSFVRLLLRRDPEVCEVDIVLDPTPQVAAPESVGRVRVDVRREIAANKLAALVSRSEVRDLVDLHALVRQGLNLDQAYEDARRKDAGVSPDMLALCVSWIPVEEASKLLSDVDVEELRAFREHLVRRFRAKAFPGMDS